MNKLTIRQKGSALIFIVIGFALVVGLGFMGYKVFQNKMSETSQTNYMPTNSQVTTEVTPSPVSSSTDVQVMTKELNDTKVDSVDQEFTSLDASASSL